MSFLCIIDGVGWQLGQAVATAVVWKTFWGGALGNVTVLGGINIRDWSEAVDQGPSVMSVFKRQGCVVAILKVS
ncbi:hypothetical protein ATO67_13595 [Agrobacterium bohemicum]|uniref:Uncharacterized protein n=1 Tax=Agrobacterium bohemicum TaxID=2052828 RepID=A0A135NY36_9HYPH|nr:hypothetical protein ATO67_13595 [Agrobacterium bohemicum]